MIEIYTDHRTSKGEFSATAALCVVRVADLDRSLQSYCDVFSCHAVSREDPHGVV